MFDLRTPAALREQTKRALKSGLACSLRGRVTLCLLKLLDLPAQIPVNAADRGSVAHHQNMQFFLPIEWVDNVVSCLHGVARRNGDEMLCWSLTLPAVDRVQVFFSGPCFVGRCVRQAFRITPRSTSADGGESSRSR